MSTQRDDHTDVPRLLEGGARTIVPEGVPVSDGWCTMANAGYATRLAVPPAFAAPPTPAVLTKEQVSSLSDVELSERLALALGGWDGGMFMFDPSEDEAVCWIVRRLRQRWALHSQGPFSVTAIYRGGDVEVRMEFAYDHTNDVFPDEVWASSASVGRSTFEAALQAVLTIPALAGRGP